jgi:hypothetical protein
MQRLSLHVISSICFRNFPSRATRGTPASYINVLKGYSLFFIYKTNIFIALLKPI